jgi:hypothetical protein
MVVVSRLKSKQVFDEHWRPFPVLVAAGPGVTTTLVTSEEYWNDHWRPATWAPFNEVRVIGRLTTVPAAPEPDAIERVTLCANPMI